MGERVRISLRTGREIPLSRMANQTYDYKSKDTYKGMFVYNILLYVTSFESKVYNLLLQEVAHQ